MIGLAKTGPRSGDDLPPLAPPGPGPGLTEVVRRRYLLGMIVSMTMKGRYQGTLLGWAWSYLQPAVRFCMFYFVFEIMIGRGAETTPNFAIHLVTGMVIVHFFTEGFSGGTQSLVSSRGLMTKMAIPKELFPVSRMLVAAWHTGPMVLILIGVCLLNGWTPDWVGVGAGLLGATLAAVLGLALSLIFSVANVYFRDFGKVVQTLNQFVTFSVPMMYPFTMVVDRFGETGSQIYMLNPVAEAVLLFQRCFWTGSTDDPELVAATHLPADLWERGFIMLGVSLALLALAQWVFTRFERGITERL